MFIKTEGDVHCGEEVCLINIILGLNNNNDEEQLPTIYCELSNKFIPEWSQRDEHINMMNIPYITMKILKIKRLKILFQKFKK